MGGFTDWGEQIADSSNAKHIGEWQSLSVGANYKAISCLAVRPADEEAIGPYLIRPKRRVDEAVKPLQHKKEMIYVVSGSDAETHLVGRFSQKTVKRVGKGLRPRSIDQFLICLSNAF